MPEPLLPLQCGFLCGTVRYEAMPDHRDGLPCHRSMCRLACAKTRAALLNLRTSELRWLSAPNAYFVATNLALHAILMPQRHAAGLRVP